MTPKQIGNIGEAVALAKFVKMQVPVYTPFGDNEKSDLLAEFNGKINRIQVKTSINHNGEIVKFDLGSTTRIKGQSKKHIYTEDEVDYYVFYNIEADVLLLVPFEGTPSTRMSFRLVPPKNGQKRGINLIEDYSFEKIIKEV